MSSLKTKTYNCECGTPEHRISFSFLEDYNQEFYIDIFMSPSVGFFGRVWLALKYVFGYKPQYGHFGQWSLNDRDLEGLIKLLNEYRDELLKESPKTNKDLNVKETLL